MSAHRRAHASVLAAALTGALAAGFFIFVSIKDTLHGINSDAAVYVLLADFYAPYRSHHFVFVNHLFEGYAFPPLYPLVLGLLGGGTASPAADYVIGAVLLGLSMSLVFVWLARAGEDIGTAAVTTAVIALSPATLFIALGVFSEPLYLALSFAALIALTARPLAARHWHAAALLFGLCALTRSVGQFAVASYVLYWLQQTRGRRYRSAPVLALALPAGWAGLKWSRGWNASYLGSLFDEGAGAALADAVEQVPVNLQALWYHLVRSFDLLGGNHVAGALVALLALAAFTFVRRLRAGELDALYVAIYLAVIVAWPYPNHLRRFLLMILPLVVAYSMWGGMELARRSQSTRLPHLVRWVMSGVLICLVLPSTLFFTMQIQQYAGTEHASKPKIAAWYGRDSQAESLAAVEFGSRLLDAIAETGRYVPATACVTSTMPEFVQLHARRRSLRPPRPGPENADILRHAEACPYVLMLRAALFPPTDYAFYYPLRELQHRLEVLHAIPLEAGDPDSEPLLILARFKGR
jgi:hypothetical protein